MLILNMKKGRGKNLKIIIIRKKGRRKKLKSKLNKM